MLQKYMLLILIVALLTACDDNKTASEETVGITENIEEPNKGVNKYVLEEPEELDDEIQEETYTYEELEETLQEIAKRVKEEQGK